MGGASFESTGGQKAATSLAIPVFRSTIINPADHRVLLLMPKWETGDRVLQRPAVILHERRSVCMVVKEY